MELRLRGRTPVRGDAAAADPTSDDADVDDASPAALPAADGDEGSVARINLRLPEYLKDASNEPRPAKGCRSTPGASGLGRRTQRGEGTRRRERPTPHGAQRYTGWAR